jgi:hypothetical protein
LPEGTKKELVVQKYQTIVLEKEPNFFPESIKLRTDRYSSFSRR